LFIGKLIGTLAMKHLDGAICLFTIVAILTLVFVISVSFVDVHNSNMALDQAAANQTALYEGEPVASSYTGP